MIKSLEFLLDNFDLKIVAQKRNGIISLVVINSLKAGETAKPLAPITISGDIEFVDQKFSELPNTIRSTETQTLYNIQAFSESLKKAEGEIQKDAQKDVKKSELNKLEAATTTAETKPDKKSGGRRKKLDDTKPEQVKSEPVVEIVEQTPVPIPAPAPEPEKPFVFDSPAPWTPANSETLSVDSRDEDDILLDL